MRIAIGLLAALASMTIFESPQSGWLGNNFAGSSFGQQSNLHHAEQEPQALPTSTQNSGAAAVQRVLLLPVGTTVMTTDWNPGPPTRGDTWTTSVPIAGHGRNLQPSAPIPLEFRFCRVSSSGVSPWPRASTEGAFCAFPT
jgi:hypothetical protein